MHESHISLLFLCHLFRSVYSKSNFTRDGALQAGIQKEEKKKTTTDTTKAL